MGKRARDGYISSNKRSRFSKKAYGKIKTTNVRRTWPYQQIGMGPKWDPFPAQATAIMRYSTVVSLNPSTGATAVQLFRANSIFDPDFTGIGHQPYGHDTYQTIYNHYNVRESTITMTPTNNVACIYGITLTDDATVQGDYDTVRELKGTKFAIAASDGAKVSAVVQKFNVNKNFDIPFQKSTSASFGQSPSEGMVFHCWAEGSAFTVDANAINFLFTISYLVDMWELKDLGQS